MQASGGLVVINYAQSAVAPEGVPTYDVVENGWFGHARVNYTHGCHAGRCGGAVAGMVWETKRRAGVCGGMLPSVMFCPPCTCP